jgi:hypothetical protein
MRLILRNMPSTLRNKAMEWPEAGMRALNKMSSTMRTVASSTIRQDYNIKKKDLDPSFSIRPASVSVLKVRLSSTGHSLKLSSFGAGRQTVEGVVINVKKAKPTLFRHAFKGKMTSGHSGIYKRIGSSRLPIKELVGPSVQQLFGSTKMHEAMGATIDSKLPALLDHEIAYLRGQL